MSLLSRFQKQLIQSGCLPPGSRVLVAVSGGADSVALLSLLHQLATTMDLHLEAAHLDHALRETSGRDADFVRQLCAELAVPLTLARQDVAEIARQRKGNLEEVARDVRRDFLATTAQALDCSLIALGHHADDQAETFLMRLLRGSGTAGLSGMRMVSGAVVRPLLPFHRDELLCYLRERGLSWHEDESNLDQAFTRNRIRHQLIPQLESYNPRIRDHLSGLCEQLRQDDDFWSALVARELGRCGEWQGEALVLSRPLLLELPPPLASRLLRFALKQVRGDLRSVTSAHIAGIQKLLGGGSPQGELDLPGTWVARRYEELLFCRRKPQEGERFASELGAPGEFLLPDARTLSLSIEKKALGESAEAVEFSAADLSFPLQLRHCRPGDRLRPSGMSGTKKLQDLFVDLKLTKEERHRALLLLKDDQILWVVGLRRAEGWRPGVGEPVLRLTVQS